MWLLELLVEHAVAAGLLTVFVTAATIVLTNYSLRLWSILAHLHLTLIFRIRFRINRIGLRLVTLDDYVALLDRLREALDARCKSHPKSKLTIYVFTMQLPRDWPLWASPVDATSPDKTALEQYFLNFDSFLRTSAQAHRPVNLKRVIVIDNCDGPTGKERLEQLQFDVNSDYFRRYVTMLHGDENQAYYYRYNRPWPGWLTDAVFYGVENTSGDIDWLWGVTTSYRAGEDLILLRFHRLSAAPLSSRFALPWGAHSLINLLDTLPAVAFTELGTLRAAPPTASVNTATTSQNASEQELPPPVSPKSPNSRKKKGKGSNDTRRTRPPA